MTVKKQICGVCFETIGEKYHPVCEQDYKEVKFRMERAESALAAHARVLKLARETLLEVHCYLGKGSLDDRVKWVVDEIEKAVGK